MASRKSSKVHNLKLKLSDIKPTSYYASMKEKELEKSSEKQLFFELDEYLIIGGAECSSDSKFFLN